MICDNAHIEHASDIVAHNVTALPSVEDSAENALVYLTEISGANQPGLYIYNAVGGWTLISNGEIVT